MAEKFSSVTRKRPFEIAQTSLRKRFKLSEDWDNVVNVYFGESEPEVAKPLENIIAENQYFQRGPLMKGNLKNDQLCHRQLISSNEMVELKFENQQDQTQEERIKLPFRCKICGLCFKFRQWLKAHELRHNGKKFPCAICGKMFLQKILLKLHLLRHISNRKQKSLKKNKWCFSEWNSSVQSPSVSQAKDVEQVAGTAHRSDFCQKLGPSRNYFYQHQRSHQRNPERPSTSNKYKSEMKLTVRKYECEICKNNFPHKKDLEMHKTMHKKVRVISSNEGQWWSRTFEQKYFECAICGRQLSGYTSLRRHLISHTGEKLFRCSICESKFTRKMTLQTHMNAVHSIGVWEPGTFECAICKKVFGKKCSMYHHFKSHHTGEKPFKCELCGKNFTRKTSLQDHMRIHTGERPFYCKLCDKDFTRKTIWRGHPGSKS